MTEKSVEKYDCCKKIVLEFNAIHFWLWEEVIINFLNMTRKNIHNCKQVALKKGQAFAFLSKNVNVRFTNRKTSLMKQNHSNFTLHFGHIISKHLHSQSSQTTTTINQIVDLALKNSPKYFASFNAEEIQFFLLTTTVTDRKLMRYCQFNCNKDWRIENKTILTRFLLQIQ